MMTLASSIMMPEFGASLSDDPGVIIYDRNVFKINDTGLKCRIIIFMNN